MRTCSLNLMILCVHRRHIRTMMSPFVMRRMKIDVLGQLPKKSTIEKLICKPVNLLFGFITLVMITFRVVVP